MRLGSKRPAFTMPEALVTMGLLLLFATLVGAVYFQGTSMAGRLDDHSKLLEEKTSLVSFLPRLCAQILPPEWASPQAVFGETPSGLKIGYWGADAKKELTLSVSNGALVASCPDGTWSWSRLAPLSVEYWKVEDRVVGLRVTWTEGQLKQSVNLAWGGRPL